VRRERPRPSRPDHGTSGACWPPGFWPGRASFAEHEYAGTTVRAVARAADVDPALVYHYYDAEENLLDAAITPPQSFLDQIAAAWQTPFAELGEQLVRQMLELAEPRA
jgi:AcrR family transcriptional regulator